MKPGSSAAGLLFLINALPMANALAAMPDEAACRGNYPVLLMTEQECRAYVRQVKVLEQSGQRNALTALKLQHAEQLSARAAVCPCIEPKTQFLAPQRVVMLDPDC